MALAGLFIHDRTVPADLFCLTIMTLLGRHEFDAAMAMPMVVPVEKRGHPLTGMGFGGKGLAGVIMPVFRCPDKRF